METTPTHSRPIRLRGVRHNNLKNLDVTIPSHALVVITGVSGSGKSSLAFDTLYAEGQRRYVESLSTYTRQFLEKMPKPDLDSIENIPPSIALEQRNHVVGSRSTVGTQTELLDYLRVLFAKIGQTFCIRCANPVAKMDHTSITRSIAQHYAGQKIIVAAPLAGFAGKKTKQLLSLFELLKSQGFSRVIITYEGKSEEPHLLQIEEISDKIKPSAGKTETIACVIDRLQVHRSDDKDSYSRLSDSVGQALKVGKNTVSVLQADALNTPRKLYESGFVCTVCATKHALPDPQLFSFNSPMGACENCSGFGFTLDLDENKVVPDSSKTLLNGAIDPLSKPSFDWWQTQFFKFLEKRKISLGTRYHELTAGQKKLIWKGDQEGTPDPHYPGIEGIFKDLEKNKYKLHVRVFIRRYQAQNICRSCNGTRLRPEALCVKIQNTTLPELLERSISSCFQFFEKLKIKGADLKVAGQALDQINKRLFYLDQIGVGYLTAARQTKTLSGGEFQRINLATQLGNGLCGTLYVLDEPSIGLHALDTERLLDILRTLRDQGNSVIVVEHDLEIIKSADWVIELGPGAGKRGGQIVTQGKNTLSEPSDPLNKTAREIRTLERGTIRLLDCHANNLKHVNLEIPLERFVVVSGVSGSGKSTLIEKTLYPALKKTLKRDENIALPDFAKLFGAEKLRDVVLMDQKPIGKSSRSNPATFIHAWDEVRRIFANQVSATRRGLGPQHFSFNVEGGRCPACKGEGEVTLDMHFLSDLKLPCEECMGKKFKPNVLEIKYRSKNILDILQMTIDEAYDLFRNNSILARKLGILRDVGLGYLGLGQSSTTLSGGESQRLKIAQVLDEQATGSTLFIFDEPTTGLHYSDIQKLMLVLQDLVNSRNSIVMIEHHLGVIAQADWVIDLGPQGGDQGGQIVAQGTPSDLMRDEHSPTGRALLLQGYKPISRQ